MDNEDGNQALVLYEEAVKNIVACKTLVETKYWMDLAEAKTLLGKITKDHRVEVEGKRLRLIAFRKANEVAERLRPKDLGLRRAGASSFLIENGFSKSNAREIRLIGALHPSTFKALISSPRPPSPTQVRFITGDGSNAWNKLIGSHGARNFASFCRCNPAKALATELAGSEVLKASEMAEAISVWVDEFIRYLPKIVERK